MKSLRTRTWLLAVSAVLLLSLYLIFWVEPFPRLTSGRPPSVSTLIRVLQRTDSRLNRFAVAAWSHLPDLVRANCRSLQPLPAQAARARACSMLADLGPKAAKATPHLVQALSDPVLNVRLDAARALGAIGPPAKGAQTALLAMLHDPAYQNPTNDPFAIRLEIRYEAALALADIAPREPEVVSALLEFMEGAAMDYRAVDVALELIRRTPEALAVFQAARKVLRQTAASAWVPALGTTYPEPKKRLAVLLGLLDDEDYGTRCEAARLLGELGPLAAEAVPKLTELFRATEKEWEELPQNPQRAGYVAYAAYRATQPGGFARRYGLRTPRPILSPSAAVTPATPAPAPGPAVTAGTFARRYRSGQTPTDGLPSTGGLHHQVILTLGKIGPPAREAIPLLVREYQDPTNQLRFDAAVARARIDGNCAAAMPVLAAGLEQPDDLVRSYVLTRISQLGGTCNEAVALFIKALGDPEMRIRLEAIASLADLRSKAAPALPALRALASDPKITVRMAAAGAVRKIESATGPQK